MLSGNRAPMITADCPAAGPFVDVDVARISGHGAAAVFGVTV